MDLANMVQGKSVKRTSERYSETMKVVVVEVREGNNGQVEFHNLCR